MKVPVPMLKQTRTTPKATKIAAAFDSSSIVAGPSRSEAIAMNLI